MKVLLDECVDPICASFFSAAFSVMHVKDIGLLGIKNGELVRVAAERFDLLVTVDRQMQFQTSLNGVAIPVAVFRSTQGLLTTAGWSEIWKQNSPSCEMASMSFSARVVELEIGQEVSELGMDRGGLFRF